MKKALMIIAAVAILGAIGLAKNHDNGPAKVGLSSQSSQPANVSAASTGSTAAGSYKNGTFTGSAADTPYGTVQIAVEISSGKITNVDFLQMPSDLGHSQEITYAAEPLLKQTTLQAQSANIDFVSGATSTSYGYEQSLQAALDQAKVS